MKACINSRRRIPLTLILSTSRMWLFSITPRPLHPQKKKNRYPLLRKPCGQRGRTVKFLAHALVVVKMAWYGGVIFKQLVVTEFTAAGKESGRNIHSRLKYVYGVNAVDKSIVALVAGSEKGKAELTDVRRSGSCFEEKQSGWFWQTLWQVVKPLTRICIFKLLKPCRSVRGEFHPTKCCWNPPSQLTTTHEIDNTESNRKTRMDRFFPHPPYSTDNAPSVFHLFGALRDANRGKSFGSYDEFFFFLKRCRVQN